MKYESFEQLKEECSKCMRCPLGSPRTNLVFGVGNENADILFVGELCLYKIGTHLLLYFCSFPSIFT